MDVTVVIPSYNDAAALELTLIGFEKQNAGASFELVIVDDGSTDDTEDVVRRYRGDAELTCISQANAGRAAARNAGIARARGRVIAFCDADTVPGPAFVERHAGAHRSGERRVVLGAKYEALARWVPGLPPLVVRGIKRALEQRPELAVHVASGAPNGERVLVRPDTLRARFDALRELTIGTAFHNHDSIVGSRLGAPEFELPWILLVSSNVSLSAELLQRAGGFDEAFRGWGYEDVELGYRLHRLGAEFVYDERAENFHLAHPRGPNEGREQATNYRRFLRKHPSLEVMLHWRFVGGVLTIDEYGALLREHRELVARGSGLAADYERICRVVAENYCEGDNPSWKGIQATFASRPQPT